MECRCRVYPYRHASKKCAIHRGGGGGGVCTGLLSWGLLIEITHASIRRDHLKFGSNAVGAGKLRCMDI